ncbi:DsbA family protein [soil metagenome]
MPRRPDNPGRKGRAQKDTSLTAVRRRSPLTPFYVIIGVVVLAGVGVLLYQMRGGAAPALEPVPVVMDQAALARVPGIPIGPESAPVVIYEFADFQCPGCAQYATFVMPLVKQRLVDEGTVRYVYYDFPLVSIHQHAFLASRAGRCANEQGRFWEYHDILYGRQPRWSAARDATPLFVDYAADAGLDRRAFESCLRSDRYAEEVSQNMRLGESLGVTGTPSIFVNGRRLQQIPAYSDLERIVREEAGTSPAAGALPGAQPDMTSPEPPSGE